MKKKKISFLLEIATLCLCIAAIAFGVYSAKQASLKVTGTIGFEAHNVEAKYTATITDAADADGTPIGTAKDVTTETDISTAFDISEVYFSDIENDPPKPVVITLTIYNYSMFPISATVIESEDMKASQSYDQLEINKTNCTLIKEKNGTTISSGKVTISIGLKAGVSSDFTMDLAFSIQLKKTQSLFTVDETTKRLTTTMGEVDGYPVEWYAFAILNENLLSAESMETMGYYSYENDKGTWYSLDGVDMTDYDYSGKTFWFIMKNVTNDSFMFADDNKHGTNMTDYVGSIVGEYVSDDNNSENSFRYVANISDDNAVYSLLTRRELKNTEGIYYNNKGTESLINRLWLPSAGEIEPLMKDRTTTSCINPNTKMSYYGWFVRDNPVYTERTWGYGADNSNIADDSSISSLRNIRACFEITL